MGKEMLWKDIIKRSRMLLNWTQEECAEELIVSKRTIEQWEAGNRIPKMLTYRQAIAEFKEWGIEYEYTHMQISGVKKRKQPATQPAEPAEQAEQAAVPDPDKEAMRQRIKKESMNREPEQYEVDLSVIGYYLDDAIKTKDRYIIEEALQDLIEIEKRISEIIERLS